MMEVGSAEEQVRRWRKRVAILSGGYRVRSAS